MNIAFISTILSHPWGGADTLWTHAAEAAAARSDRLLISVSPLVASHPRVAALAQSGARIVLRAQAQSAPGIGARIARRVVRALRSADPLLAALAEFRPDLVIFSLGGTYDLILQREWIGWLSESGTAFRLIANWQYEHPRLSEQDLATMREVFASADSVNFVSSRNLEATRRHLLQRLPNARVLQNPLRWTPSDTPPWPRSNAIGLATVSRLDEAKGIHLLLHALSGCRVERQDWLLNIYGIGPQERYLKDTVAYLKLEPLVRFHGYVGSLRAIWEANHLMISAAIDEGVPMTIPEAMLCERPVLATRVGGAEDWIEHGRTGFLCDSTTVPLLTRSLQTAIESRRELQDMGQSAAAAARSRYRPNDHLLLIDPRLGARSSALEQVCRP